MASPCEVLLDGQDEGSMHDAAAAIAEVRRIECKYSRYRPDSVVSRINAAAGGLSLEVDEETAGLLAFAGRLWQQSAGLFDATSGVLRRAWDFSKGRRAEQRELDALLSLVGWSRVEHEHRRVRLPVAGMELDFGGFGKEYPADRAAGVLRQRGIEHALVNLGGDIHVLGPRGLPELRGRPWEVAIEHPRAAGTVLANLPLARGGLATSGDYERFFECDGVRYCHILDPRTGWPVSHWQSVTVLAVNTTTAGALSTIAMLQGGGALEWLELQDASYLAVRHDGELFQRRAPPDGPEGGALPHRQNGETKANML